MLFVRTAAYFSTGSGSMEFPTFLALVPKLKHQGDSEDEIDEAFRVFDKEGNGQISAAELRWAYVNIDI